MIPRTHIPILKPKKKEKAKRKGLRKVSRKMAKRSKEYAVLRKEFLAKHPICQHWLAENGWEELHFEGIRYYLCKNNGPYHLVALDSVALARAGAPTSDEIHHMRGRGRYHLDTNTWMAVRAGHDQYIHQDPDRYKKGYCLPR